MEAPGTPTRRGWPFEPVDLEPAPPARPAGPLVLPAATERNPLPVAPPVVDAAPRPERPPPALNPERAAMRRSTITAIVASVLLVVLVLGGIAGDWSVRTAELRRLLDRIEASETAQVLPVRRLRLMLWTCREPIDDGCDPEAARAAVVKALPELDRTGDAVAAVEIARLHPEIKGLRNRYVEHSQAWRIYFRAIAADPAASVDYPATIGITWDAAGEAARRALPPLARDDDKARVERIFGPSRLRSR